MKNTKTTISVKFTQEGFHCWPNAPEHREYLRYRHRHLFHVEIKIEVSHNERDVEFHDLLSMCRKEFSVKEKGTKSCETMAQDLHDYLSAKFDGRWISVEVSEDGEFSATVKTVWKRSVR
jgi:hypothetical protein